MNKADEDALASTAMIDCQRGGMDYGIRLAIRAAYARGVEAERERCAKFAELYATDYQTADGALLDVAAAIRRGE